MNRVFKSMGKRFKVKAVFYIDSDEELSQVNDYLSDFNDRAVIQEKDGEIIIAMKEPIA